MAVKSQLPGRAIDATGPVAGTTKRSGMATTGSTTGRRKARPDSGERQDVLARRLGEERRRQGLTLADLAARSGLSISTLSKVENGRMSLTYGKLAAVADGLGIEVAALFRMESPPRPAGRRCITRPRDQHPTQLPGMELRYLAEDLLEKRLVPMVMTVKARTLADAGGLKCHGGEEVYYVLSGTTELHTDLYAPLRLDQGDCVYMDGSMGHTFISVGAGDAVLFAVNEGHPVYLAETGELCLPGGGTAGRPGRFFELSGRRPKSAN